MLLMSSRLPTTGTSGRSGIRTRNAIDTLPPLGKDHCVHFAGWLLTTREHLKDFDLIDVDNWIELVDPLIGVYRF
jgi:hypothetical protein